ncbi:hypothetical protein HGRIS_006276 [Hohenbuehelia grisea]|uniref:Uncharacterized protein n=1 Tax=Hohenbuehelia grisea TaxID=104357 RepID=A0ABR3K258_9AGAR
MISVQLQWISAVNCTTAENGSDAECGGEVVGDRDRAALSGVGFEFDDGGEGGGIEEDAIRAYRAQVSIRPVKSNQIACVHELDIIVEHGTRRIAKTYLNNGLQHSISDRMNVYACPTEPNNPPFISPNPTCALRFLPPPSAAKHVISPAQATI